MDIQRAIHVLQDCGDTAKGTEFEQIYQMAISALQEQEEREKGCEYCERGHDLSTGNACEPSLYIQGNTLIALRYDEPDSEAEIHYCPKCGRRLK